MRSGFTEHSQVVTTNYNKTKGYVNQSIRNEVFKPHVKPSQVASDSSAILLKSQTQFSNGNSLYQFSLSLI
jgi:NhaP-type Na+/H+ and K+/H+ antiporter